MFVTYFIELNLPFIPGDILIIQRTIKYFAVVWVIYKKKIRFELFHIPELHCIMGGLSALLTLYGENPLMTSGFHPQRACNAELWCIMCNETEQTVELSVISYRRSAASTPMLIRNSGIFAINVSARHGYPMLLQYGVIIAVGWLVWLRNMHTVY